MITNREAISRIKKSLREVNADSRFSNKLAYSILQTAARVLIKRENDKLKLYNQTSLFQSYKCVEIIEAPLIDPCCGVKTLCKTWRTKEKLPKYYEDADGPIIKSIYTIDGSERLESIKPTDYINILNNPWIKKDTKKYYFYSDGYLYFPKGAYKKVEIMGYNEELINNSCDEYSMNDCVRFLDQPFRVPGYLEKNIFELAQQEIANTYLRIKERGHQIDKNDNTLNIQS